jgi:predicted CoA-binding protein
MTNVVHLWGEAEGGWRRTRCGQTAVDASTFGALEEVPPQVEICETCRESEEAETIARNAATVLPPMFP